MELKQFVVQGLTGDTHRAAMEALFDVGKIERSLFSVAFLTGDGVDHIASTVQGRNTTVFAGIRNGITSIQALEKLLTLVDSLYVVDTGSRTLLFHPKLFLVRGQNFARLLVGSANLTLGGLNNNIEAGVLLNFDLAIREERTVVNDIENTFHSLPRRFPHNTAKVRSKVTLGRLFLSGLLVDETMLPAPHPTTAARLDRADTVPRMHLSVARLFGSRKSVGRINPTKQPGSSRAQRKHIGTGVELQLVWQSKALTRRDLTIPKSTRSNQTGSMNLDKGLLATRIDHRHFFRNEVFHALPWKASGRVETVVGTFHVVIKGVSYGAFSLRLSHTTSTTSVAYVQRNAMTRLQWGPIRRLVAREDLIGRTLSLFRDKADGDRFTLDVD